MIAPATRLKGWACCLALLAALLSGCITPAARDPDRSDPATGTETRVEPAASVAGEIGAFDPWLLPESPIRFGNTGVTGQGGGSVPHRGPLAAAPVNRAPAGVVVPAESPAAGLANAGTRTWRVQLYSGRSPATADALVAEARLLFPEHKVDRVGDLADLKVLMGQFDSPASAAGLKQRAVRLGFAQAWVVESGPDLPH